MGLDVWLSGRALALYEAWGLILSVAKAKGTYMRDEVK